MTIQIRDNGDANAQVTDQVKDDIYDHLEDRGVTAARDGVLLHHYQDGDFVAVSNFALSSKGQKQSLIAFNNLRGEIVDEYWRNKKIDDDCFWVHREWIDSLD